MQQQRADRETSFNPPPEAISSWRYKDLIRMRSSKISQNKIQERGHI